MAQRRGRAAGVEGERGAWIEKDAATRRSIDGPDGGGSWGKQALCENLEKTGRQPFPLRVKRRGSRGAGLDATQARIREHMKGLLPRWLSTIISW